MYEKAISDHPPDRSDTAGAIFDPETGSILGVVSHLELPEDDTLREEEDFKQVKEHTGYKWLWIPSPGDGHSYWRKKSSSFRQERLILS
jgi:hypothetical protein